jgi:hypothetical protein
MKRQGRVKHSTYRILFDCKTPPPSIQTAPFSLHRWHRLRVNPSTTPWLFWCSRPLTPRRGTLKPTAWHRDALIWYGVVKKMELSESIGVTLKDGVWCWTSDTMLVAEVVCGISSSCVFLRTLYPGGRGLVTYFGAVGKRGRWGFTIK